jgi:hypothetical protein
MTVTLMTCRKSDLLKVMRELCVGTGTVQRVKQEMASE